MNKRTKRKPQGEVVVTYRNGAIVAVTRQDKQGRVLEIIAETKNVKLPGKAGELVALHEHLCTEARSLMERKNHDYTSGSGDVLANFRGSNYLGIHPVTGIQLRQQDKMMRVKTFVEKGELKVKSESVKDAIVDQINYLVLQYAYLTEDQPAFGLGPQF